MTSATLLTGPPSGQALPAPGGELAGTAAERLVLLVAPSNGRFRPQVTTGALDRGAVLGHVTGARGRSDAVSSPVAATVKGLLALPGHLVTRGQALAWAQVEERGRAA